MYKVTIPSFTCVEIENQEFLGQILPKLCTDFAKEKTDTLTDYHVEWTHSDISAMVTQFGLDKFIIKQMYIQAGQSVEIPCELECWNTESVQTMPFHTFTSEQRNNLPTNDTNTERYLAKLGYLIAQSVEYSNKLVKANRIKDNFMLKDASCTELHRSASIVLK